ncbi:prostaglandin reductase 2-like isoform X2 [Dreissena polymorpha]|uniref:prostaglandin reductase 2-like isoform X2 n=1 Tax=Dreissena polymorpha TaxID=45954 RepID=UPI0022641EE4|nr:prostaglandin reductase 2-like isoform X2 [Dreissena polymorpha]
MSNFRTVVFAGIEDYRYKFFPTMSNARVIFKSRPGADNAPMVSNFQCEACSVPDPPGQGELTINSLFLSLDPALRCRMNDSTGVDYMKEWTVGEPVLGLGGVGVVTASCSASFAVGDMVQALMNWPWVERFNTRVDSALFPLYKLDDSLKYKPQLVLSLFGITGLTSYLGVKERGQLSADTKQTFVVSGAAGACGNLAGQMSPNSRVILCGQIAVYNKDLPYPPPISEEIQSILAERNITRERFLVLAYEDQFTDALRQLQLWYSEGKLKVPEFVHEGLKSAPQAFVDMITSVRQTHVGKQIVSVSWRERFVESPDQ